MRDQNWHRGGYGVISLEQALGHSSQVAFTKAREMAFGNRQNKFYDRISTYLSSDPNYVIGVLAFYNAGANGGKMVQLTKKGYGVTVMDEQIAAPEHIATLQKGLRNAVTKGLFRRVDRDYINVAALVVPFRLRTAAADAWSCTATSLLIAHYTPSWSHWEKTAFLPVQVPCVDRS